MAVVDNPELSKSTLLHSLSRPTSDSKVVMGCLEEGRCQLLGP